MTGGGGLQPAEKRAVFIIDGHGRIAYTEYVADQMREPDYVAAMSAARHASEDNAWIYAKRRAG